LGLQSLLNKHVYYKSGMDHKQKGNIKPIDECSKKYVQDCRILFSGDRHNHTLSKIYTS